MNNRDNAAYIIENYGLNCERCNEKKDICEICAKRARFAVDALADAGLLAPELPEPLTAANGNPVWRADNTLMVTRYPDNEIAMMLSWEQEARYTPQTARAQAALLLAAANRAEGNKDLDETDRGARGFGSTGR